MKKIQYNNDVKGMLPPQSPQAEETVLGAMLIDRNAIDEALTLVKSPEVFYKEEHQHVFTAIKQLVDKSTGVDLITVVNQLRANGTIDAVGGDLFIVSLMQKVASSAHIEHHCRIILQDWVKRTIITISRDQISNSFAETVDVFDLLAESEKGLDAVNEMLETSKHTVDFPEALSQCVQRIEL
ncbi:DnaB-like helicase N-terminal domain-containing protein, partial [Candidatus Venteria ishoeyi]